MILYESGESVYDKYIGLQNSYKNYVCVDDDFTSCNTIYSFNKMKNFLLDIQKLSLRNINEEKLTCEDFAGNTYSLCVERTIDKQGKFKIEKSTLIRDISSRFFTKDCMYIDENNEIVFILKNIKKGAGNILIDNNTSLIKKLYSIDDSIILDIIKYKVMAGLSVSDNILDLLLSYPIPSDVKKIEKLLISLYPQSPNRVLNFCDLTFFNCFKRLFLQKILKDELLEKHKKI